MVSNECVEYARECVRLAGLVEEPELRERLLSMAREWMAVAMQEQQTPEAKPLKSEVM
jgi:hypothetical protein